MRGILLVLALWVGGFALATPPASILAPAVDTWMEAGESTSVEQVAAAGGPARFSPSAEGGVYQLIGGGTLWLRLRWPTPPHSQVTLGIDLPVPLLDEATLYVPRPGGGFAAQHAGDQLAVEDWDRPGRYASFALTVPQVATPTAFLRVRHVDTISFPLRIGSALALEQGRQVEYLVLGLVGGSLLLLSIFCLIQGVVHRDAIYAGYTGYAATMLLAMAAVTGIAGHLLWPQAAVWNNLSQGALPVLLAGVNLLFVRHLCGIGARFPQMHRASGTAAMVLLLLAAAYGFVTPPMQSAIVVVSLVLSPALGLASALLAWRRRDPVGGWVLLAHTPLAVAALAAAARVLGLLPAGWLTMDGTAVATALAVPLLLPALGARSRERHWMQNRVNHLTQQDALTGLLSPAAFEAQVRVVVQGAMMRREAAAVILIDVANLQQIRRFHGDAMAEQCLLRAVMKLHRVIREGDAAGRLGTDCFGVILEGCRARSEVQDRMVRLIASGLAPSKGVALDQPLQFRVVCIMLREYVLAAPVLLARLREELARTSPRTRRPVRFIEPPGSDADTVVMERLDDGDEQATVAGAP